MSEDTTTEQKSKELYQKQIFNALSLEIFELYKEGKYYSILSIVSSNLSYENLPTRVRLYLALSLVKLGRIDIGLRELAICIECSSFENRYKLLGHLGLIFKNMKIYDRAAVCFNEGVYWLKHNFKNANILNDHQKSKMIKIYEKELSKCLGFIIKTDDSYFANEISKHYCKKSIHEQALDYLEDNGNFNEFSLGRIAILNYDNCRDAINFLKEWKEMDDKSIRFLSDSKDPLHKFFASIKSFAPRYVFNELLAIEAIVLSFINFEASNHPEFDINADALLVIDVLVQTSSIIPIKLCSLIVKFKTIIAFMHFLREDYPAAVKSFKWILKFFEGIDDKFGINIDFSKNDYLSSVTKRSISILCGQCLVLNDERSEDELKGILMTIISSSSDINITCEYISGRLTQFFLVCGNIYEQLSFVKGTKVTIESLSCDKESSPAMRLSKKHVEESIRKYILASTMKPNDDPSVTEIYDRILWGLLTYGGIHIKALWFFKFLRDHFKVTSDFGPIDLRSNFNNSNFKTSLMDDNDGWSLVYKIYSLKDQLAEDEISSSWDERNGTIFLIPQVFINSDDNSLILMDEFFDERSPYGTEKSFVMATAQRAKRKLKSHIKLHEAIVKFHLEKSKQLIALWIESYTKYQTKLPPPIAEFWEKYIK